MFETDAPDQNLYPNYKSNNKPINLILIIDQYAKITKQCLTTVLESSIFNTIQFFKLTP